MPWYKGSAKVVAEDVEDSPFPPERRGLSGWIKKHPVISAVAITLLILGVITAIVVPVTCSVHGCPPKAEQETLSTIYSSAPKRLVVSFLADLDVNDLVPPILRPYTSRVKLLLSNLQVLEAVDDAILQAVLAELRKRTDIEFLVQDFVLRAPTIVETATSGSGTSARRSLQQTQDGYTLDDPGLSNAWWFNKLNLTSAWQQLGVDPAAPWTQNSDVVIAVTDSGAWINHPDLQMTWWTNPNEVDNDRVDNDNNTFIDDSIGAAFGGSACSPLWGASNVSGCGIGRNTAAWNGIVDRFTHGSKIAGVIGATPGNGIGLAGAAPNLRQMILKVTDETIDWSNPTYAFSDVVRAVDYGYGKGARIFSMSFGPNAKNSFNPTNKPGMDNAASAYRTLFTKYSDALFVSAAGNEWTSLETWRAANYTYPPCMVETPNSLCVGGTNASDSIFYLYAMNQDIGTNWGPTTVDMGAPGFQIYTTDAGWVNNYTTVSGTSFSTPLVAAVAGLVLSAMGGQSRTTPATPQLIKQILMTSGDVLPSLQGRFKSTRRLNAGNAVAAALTYAGTNRTVLKLARTFSSVNPTVMFQGWENYWWRKRSTDGIVLEPFGLTLADYQIRNSNTSNFPNFRYSSGMLLVATALVRIDTPGPYSLLIRTQPTVTPDEWQVVLGESTLVFNMAPNGTVGTVDLLFPDPGYYNMTFFHNSDGSAVNFQWQTPTSSAWSNPANMFYVIREEAGTTRGYDPNVSPKPAVWHVVWNESTTFDDFTTSNRGFFFLNREPRLYRTLNTILTDFSFPTGTDLRNALYGTGNGPANGATVVYGYARANLRPENYSSPMGFRMQGPHSRLFINGQNIFDFQSDATLMIITPCVTLRNNTAHEIFFYFAARLTSSNPVGITWTRCVSTVPPPGPTGPYASLTPSLATNYLWQTNNITSLPRGFRCDAWPARTPVSVLGSAPPIGTPPTLTWMLPRDCPANSLALSGECRINYNLNASFPSITWNNWHIRCYTYWAGSFTGGLTYGLNLGGPMFQHLLGVRVYDQVGNGREFANYAPYSTRLPSNTYQLFVIEWVALSQQWNRLALQTVFNGVLSGGNVNTTLTTDSAAMILPPSAVAPLAWKDPEPADLVNVTLSN